MKEKTFYIRVIIDMLNKMKLEQVKKIYLLIKQMGQ